MGDKVRFGQQRPERLHVEPQFGRLGTVFRFNATNFDPGKQLRVMILSPNGQPIYDRYLVTDEGGSLGYIRLELRPIRGWPLGQYSFLVISEAGNKHTKYDMPFQLGL